MTNEGEEVVSRQLFRTVAGKNWDPASMFLRL